MLRCMLLLCALALTARAWLSDYVRERIIPGSMRSHRRPMEVHHSISHPFDQGSVYWKFGGSAVMTKSKMRLVPSRSSRIGWLWNDYPIESKDWSVEFAVQAGAPYGYGIGGDGFAMWIVSSALDPYHFKTPDYLHGPIFGMRDDFQGIGILFDTYDNDDRRDNPTISVIENYEGKAAYDHETDFAQASVKTTAESSIPHKCYAALRNTEEPYKVIVRFVKDVLHVYVGNQGEDPKSCLAVRLDRLKSIEEKHVAFTAMTGQVAEFVDITDVKTWYLDDKDAEIIDSMLQHSDGHEISHWGVLAWLIMLGLSIMAAYLSFREFVMLEKYRRTLSNPVYICAELNRMVWMRMLPGYVFGAFALVTLHFLALLLLLPIVIHSTLQVMNGSHLFDIAILSGGGKGKQVMIPYRTAAMVRVGLWGLLLLHCVISVFRQ